MATITSAGSGNWATGGTWVGGSAPADDDAVVIAAGHSVLMNADLSAYTGLRSVTITSSSGTPGMLYFTTGTSGYLKLRSTYSIVGTNAANKGRLLANSDGVWGNTGSLPFADKAVIDLQGTAKINAQYLDIALYCTEPTNKYVETYKTAYTCADQTTGVNTTTDVITFSASVPADNTAVRVRSSGTLPGGLHADDIYYVYSGSGSTCKLAHYSATSWATVDITSTGTGALTMYSGHTDTATATMNVIQDVTGDTPWVTTDGHDRVALCDVASENYDQQRLQLTTINSGSIVLSANVDSAQFPLARIVLASRNVSIRSATTTSSTAICDYASATSSSGVFNCEIGSTGGSGTTFYGYGIVNGTNHTIGGVLWGLSRGTSAATTPSISGVIAACSNGIYQGTNPTFSGVIIGCATGANTTAGGTFSGDFLGCSTGLSNCNDSTFSGKTVGGGIGLSSCYRSTIGGAVRGAATTAIAYCSASTISSIITGSQNGFGNANGAVFSGTITGAQTTGLNSCQHCIMSGTINKTATGIFDCAPVYVSGTISNCTIAFIQNSEVIGSGMTLTGNAADFAGVAQGYPGSQPVSRSFRHAGTANDTRAWNSGGAMTHETTTIPTGKSYSHKFTYTSASYWCLMEWEITRAQGKALYIPVWAKHDATSLAEAARLHWQIVDLSSDPLAGGTALDEWIAADSTDWQQSALEFTRVDDRPLVLRVCAQRGSGNAYAYVEPASVTQPTYVAGVM